MKRLDQWKDELEAFDQQVTGNADLRIVWEFEFHVHAGAFVAEEYGGPEIRLNYQTIEHWFRTLPAARAVRRLRGVNYHELGHALFSDPAITPASGSSLGNNALEDQRVERLIIERFPESRPRPLELLSMEDSWSALYVHGRTYLPVAARIGAGLQFARAHGKEALAELEFILGAYTTTGDHPKAEELGQLADRFRRLLVQIGREPTRHAKTHWVPTEILEFN